MASQAYSQQHGLPATPGQSSQPQYSTYNQSPPRSAGTDQQPPYNRRRQSQQAPQQSSHTAEPSQYKNQKSIRPKSRAFSFHSDKSHKTDLHETSAEKESKRLHTKADPTLAMQEMEPSAVAAHQSRRALPSMSEIEWRDATGTPITEPDRSNPSRSKWERPLDTIRSFEAAIDGGYNNRQSFIRTDSDSVANYNRRSGLYPNSYGPTTPRFPQNSYYGARPSSTVHRSESTGFDPRGQGMPDNGNRDSYFEGYDGAYGYGANGNTGNRNRVPRNYSESQLNGRPAADRNVYPVPSNHRSYETVATGSGRSGSPGDAVGYQTDPTSSENSSIDRRMPPRQRDPANDYGISFGQAAAYQPPSLSIPASQPRTMPDGSNAVPPPAPKQGGGGLLRKGSKTAGAQQGSDKGDKRKSWLARRFSKNS
ncbi:hypothetical protein PG996_001548 [Apiospora saccharicola]|uniref:DUF2406 domain-containing protein n=1 Tax=Apiospora saccharicola TaxID=335842 RepID=A0ABR1WH19_9PEZI